MVPPRSISGSPTVAISQSRTAIGRVGSSRSRTRLSKRKSFVDHAVRDIGRLVGIQPGHHVLVVADVLGVRVAEPRRPAGDLSLDVPVALVHRRQRGRVHVTWCRSMSTSSALRQSSRSAPGQRHVRREVAARDDARRPAASRRTPNRSPTRRRSRRPSRGPDRRPPLSPSWIRNSRPMSCAPAAFFPVGGRRRIRS